MRGRRPLQFFLEDPASRRATKGQEDPVRTNVREDLARRLESALSETLDAIQVERAFPLRVWTDSKSRSAYASATALTHDGLTQKSQKAANPVSATATTIRITTVLFGLGKMSHHGSGHGLPQIVSNSRVQQVKTSRTAMVVPTGRRPHKLRLKCQ